MHLNDEPLCPFSFLLFVQRPEHPMLHPGSCTILQGGQISRYFLYAPICDSTRERRAEGKPCTELCKRCQYGGRIGSKSLVCRSMAAQRKQSLAGADVFCVVCTVIYGPRRDNFYRDNTPQSPLSDLLGKAGKMTESMVSAKPFA